MEKYKKIRQKYYDWKIHMQIQFILIFYGEIYIYCQNVISVLIKTPNTKRVKIYCVSYQIFKTHKRQTYKHAIYIFFL